MVELIPYQHLFLEPFVRWRSQPSWVRHNPLLPKTAEEIAQILESEGSDLRDLRAFESYRWFIDYEGGVVGSVSLRNINHMMSYAEIGYGVDEAYHGRGIATAAVRALVELVFHDSPLRKLLAFVHEKNIPSRRVLEKLGFVQEGFLREHYIINGVAENEILFGLLRREWKQPGA